MRSTLVALSVSLVCLTASSPSWAKKPKPAAAAKGGGDHSVDQTLSWEQKVMGDDSDKRAAMDKINAARIAQEKAKNAPPPAPKAKDPNKEGVHAKGEASIDLAIPGDEPQARTAKAPGPKKPKAVANSNNDELGQLVAATLQEDKAAANESGKGAKKAVKVTKAKKQSDSLSSMDQMLANQH